MKASVIIPAFNEANRIGPVLEILVGEKIGEIIVVDDGSTDNTAEVASKYGVKLFQLANNKGKAHALTSGVEVATFETLLFLDADLIGLCKSHIDAMLRTYWGGNRDMVIGVFHNGRLNTDISQKINPHLSGQRVLSKSIWNQLNKDKAFEFGVEMALTKLTLKKGFKTEKVKLEGVTHVMKEEKRGFGEGFKSRLRMYGDIIKTAFTGS